MNSGLSLSCLKRALKAKSYVGFHKRLPGTYPHDAQLDYFRIA